VQQIADWFKRSAAPEYIEHFAENKIDAGRTGVDPQRHRRAAATGVAAAMF